MPQAGAQEKPITCVMSGMRPSGVLHIGHYFGVIKNWLSLQEKYTCYFGAMDWHAMTTLYKTSDEIKKWSRDYLAEWIAWGINPDKVTLFVQSQVPQHLELFSYFSMLTPIGWLERVPTWKDAEEEAKKNDTHNLGRMGYPVLQAADIALYGGSHVPIGHDQVSHLEISREIIRRFNKIYSADLPEPLPLFTETPVIPGLDGRKMSSSYGNALPLTMEEKPLRKLVNKMVTDPQRVRREDPGNPEVCSVHTYHKLFSSDEDLKWVRHGCTTAGIGCGDCKGRLAENINRWMAGPREKKKELLKDPHQLDSIVAQGCQKARERATETMNRVHRATGFMEGI